MSTGMLRRLTNRRFIIIIIKSSIQDVELLEFLKPTCS